MARFGIENPINIGEITRLFTGADKLREFSDTDTISKSMASDRSRIQRDPSSASPDTVVIREYPPEPDVETYESGYRGTLQRAADDPSDKFGMIGRALEVYNWEASLTDLSELVSLPEEETKALIDLPGHTEYEEVSSETIIFIRGNDSTVGD